MLFSALSARRKNGAAIGYAGRFTVVPNPIERVVAASIARHRDYPEALQTKNHLQTDKRLRENH
jgi:hypothetical protein